MAGMRAKQEERERATGLRKLGFSYSEIQARIPVSQASLSLWLRGIKLSASQRRRLAKRKLIGQRQAAEEVHRKKLVRIASTMDLAEPEARQFISAKELLWVIGTVLYWAEGTKIKEWPCKERVAFTNMDPAMIRVVRAWLMRYCSVGLGDLEYALYIHPNADVEAAHTYWTQKLGIIDAQLRTYFKKHNPSPRRRHVGRTYYGTMRLAVRRSTLLAHRINGWIRAVVFHCGVG